MDLPLLIFTGLLICLIVGGIAGLFIFQKSSRRARPGRPVVEEPSEPEPIMLSDLELQAHALAGLVAEVEPEEAPVSGVSLFRVRLGTLPATAPRSAIMKAWRELENSALRTLAQFDFGDYPVTRLRSIEMMSLLVTNGALQDAHFEICRALEDIRNAVFGLTNLRVGMDVANRVVDATDLLVTHLHDFRELHSETPPS